MDLVRKTWFVFYPLHQIVGLPQDTIESQALFLESGETYSSTTTSNLMKGFFIRSPMRFSFKIWDLTPNAQILKLIRHFQRGM